MTAEYIELQRIVNESRILVAAMDRSMPDIVEREAEAGRSSKPD
jgi:hypothetical protein